jgi:hypothetical protein
MFSSLSGKIKRANDNKNTFKKGYTKENIKIVSK